MKRFAIFLILVAVNTGLYAQGYHVKEYSADIYLHKKGYFDIVEKYDVEFTLESHGIYRYINTKFKYESPSGEIVNRRIYLSKIKTPREKHKTSPDKTLQNFSDRLAIRIGSEKRKVYGNHQYEIRYRVKNALFEQDSIAQLYWNVKPSDWQATFDKISFTVHLPDGVKVNNRNTFVYAGADGTSQPSQKFEYSYDEKTFTATSKPDFSSLQNESVTVLMNMPKGAFSNIEYTPSLIRQYGWVITVILPLLFFVRLRQKYGKNKKVIAVTSYYPPEGIDPAMAGYLINNRADADNLISLLPKWGAEGLIQISEIPKKSWFGKADTAITKLKNLPEDASTYEKIMFRGLFSPQHTISGEKIMSFIQNVINSSSKEEFDLRQKENQDKTSNQQITVLVSKLKNSFHKNMESAKQSLTDASKIYYEADIRKKKKKMVGYGLVWLIIGGAILYFIFGWLAVIGNVITTIIGLQLLKGSHKRNTKGGKVLGELQGFKQFVKVAETNRISVLIKEDPNYFEKTMSYALTFGLLKKWAKKFDALDIEPPKWYANEAGHQTMRMSSFASSFSNRMATTKSTMVSTPKTSSSSGGGAAGGGAGSGGGGRW